MSEAKGRTGLALPGRWLAHVAVPPPHLSAWGILWRLVVRWTATAVMTAVAVLAIRSAVTSPRSIDLIDLLLAVSGWLYSALLTVGVTVVIARIRRDRRSARRPSSDG